MNEQLTSNQRRDGAVLRLERIATQLERDELSRAQAAGLIRMSVQDLRQPVEPTGWQPTSNQWVTTPQLQRGRPYDGAVERNGTLVIPRDPFERCCVCAKKNPCKGHKP